MTDKESLMNSNKALLFFTYCKIFNLDYDSDELYDNITNEKMINEIFNFYINNKNHFIINALNEFDIDILEKMINKYPTPNYVSYHGIYNLFICDIHKEEVADELYPTVENELNYYFDNIELIKENKEKAYIIVGLIRTYGILTYDELNKLFNHYYDNLNIDDYINHPYVIFNTYHHNNIYYDNNTLIPYKDLVLNNHNKLFDNIYDYKYINTRGRYYFDTFQDEYLNIINDINLFDFMIIYNEDISKFKGLNYSFNEFINKINIDINNNEYINNKNIKLIKSFYESQPSYLLDLNEEFVN